MTLTAEIWWSGTGSYPSAWWEDAYVSLRPGSYATMFSTILVGDRYGRQSYIENPEVLIEEVDISYDMPLHEARVKAIYFHKVDDLEIQINIDCNLLHFFCPPYTMRIP